MVHGINWLPFHGGSLYLGHFPGYVRKEYDALVRENGGAKWDAWADLIWMFQALTDPEGALEAFERAAATVSPEAGSSKAFVYHWLHNLDALGQVDGTVTADDPCHAVFTKNGRRAYVVYSHSPGPRTVRFADATSLRIPERGWTVALGTPKEGTP